MRYNSRKDTTDYGGGQEFESQDTFVTSLSLKVETQTNRYYVVKDIVEKYLESIYRCNNYDGRDLNFMAMTEKDLQDAIQDQKNIDLRLLQNIVAEECVDAFNPSDYNYYGGYNLNIDNIYVAEAKSSIGIYVIYGTIVNTGETVKLMVVLDNNNLAYNIYPENYLEENNMLELKEGDNINLDIESVEKNNLNGFKYKNVDLQTIALDYFNNYKNKLNNVEELYNSLDEEYRNKRFQNIDNFKEYIEKNREELESAVFSEYTLNNLTDYNEYVCKDQYGNYYIFKATAVMKYTMLLDTYTIITDEFTEQYNSGTDDVKVKLNIDRWIKMLNNRDYKTAYNYLDETFRANNFNNDQTVFESYMRDKYPGHYEVLYGDIIERNGIYSQSIILKDITGEDETEYPLDMIMKLGDDMNFVMSFTLLTK